MIELNILKNFSLYTAYSIKGQIHSAEFKAVQSALVSSYESFFKVQAQGTTVEEKAKYISSVLKDAYRINSSYLYSLEEQSVEKTASNIFGYIRNQTLEVVNPAAVTDELTSTYSDVLINMSKGIRDAVKEEKFLVAFEHSFGYRPPSFESAYIRMKSLVNIDESTISSMTRSADKTMAVSNFVKNAIWTSLSVVSKLKPQEPEKDDKKGGVDFTQGSSTLSKTVVDLALQAGLFAVATSQYHKTLLPFYIQKLENEAILSKIVDVKSEFAQSIISQNKVLEEKIIEIHSRFFGKQASYESIVKSFESYLSAKGVNLKAFKELIASNVLTSPKIADIQEPLNVASSFFSPKFTPKDIVLNKLDVAQAVSGQIVKTSFKNWLFSPSAKSVEPNTVGDYIGKEVESAKGVARTAIRTKETIDTIKHIPEYIRRVVDATRLIFHFIAKLTETVVLAFTSGLALPVMVTILVVGLIAAMFPALLYGGITHLSSEQSLGDIYALVTKRDAYVSSWIFDEISNISSISYSNLRTPCVDDWYDNSIDKQFIFPLGYANAPLFDRFSDPSLYTDPNALIAYLSAMYENSYSYPYFAYPEGAEKPQIIDIREMIQPFTKGTLAGHSYIEIKAPNDQIILKSNGNKDDFLYNIQIDIKQYFVLKKLLESGVLSDYLRKQVDYALLMKSLPEFKVRKALGYDSDFDQMFAKAQEISNFLNTTNLDEELKKSANELKNSVMQNFDNVIATYEGLKNQLNSIKSAYVTHYRISHANVNVSYNNCSCTFISGYDDKGNPIYSTVTVMIANVTVTLASPPDTSFIDVAKNELDKQENKIKDIKTRVEKDFQDFESSLQPVVWQPGDTVFTFLQRRQSTYLDKIDKFTCNFVKDLRDFSLILTQDFPKIKNYLQPISTELSMPLPNFHNEYCNACGCYTCCSSGGDCSGSYASAFNQASSSMKSLLDSIDKSAKDFEKIVEQYKKDFKIKNVFTVNLKTNSPYASLSQSDIDDFDVATQAKILNNFQGNVLANFILKRALPKGDDKVRDAREMFAQIFSPYGFLLKQELYYPDVTIDTPSSPALLYHRFGYMFDICAFVKYGENTINPTGIPPNDLIGTSETPSPTGYFTTGSSTALTLFGVPIMDQGFLDNVDNWYGRTILYKGIVLVSPDYFNDVFNLQPHTPSTFPVYSLANGEVKIDKETVFISDAYDTSDKERDLTYTIALKGDFSKENIPEKVDSSTLLGQASILYIEYNKVEPVYGTFLWKWTTEKDVHTYKNPLSYITWQEVENGD
ncbi:MAG: hypothetical protein QXE51_00015 [Nitrososphaeria archaeon]